MKFAPKQIDWTKDIEMLGGQILLSDGSAQEPGLAFDSSGNTGLFLEDGRLGITIEGEGLLDIASDGVLRFLGNSATKLPVGTTEQRPTPVNGMIRYNSETSTYEVVNDAEWNSLVLSSDSRLTNAGQIIVCKNPGDGQFSSVKAAVESIDPEALSAYTQFQVKVLPGIYVENSFTIPPFVHVTGEQLDNCQLVAANPDADFIIIKSASSVENFVIMGANGENGSAMHITGVIEAIPGISIAYPVALRNLAFYDNTTHLQVHNHDSDIPTVVTGQGISIGFEAGNQRGIEVLAENGKSCSLTITDLQIDNGSSGLTEAIYVDGSGGLCSIAGFTIKNSIPNPTPVDQFDIHLPVGCGLRVRDGGIAQLIGGNIDAYDKNIWLENAGASPILIAQGVSIPGSGEYNLLIEHPLALGSFNGTAVGSKVYMEPTGNPEVSSQFSLTYQDVESGNYVNVGGLVIGNDFENLVDVTDMITQGAPMGVVTGGVMSVGDPFEVNVSAGYGFIDAGGTNSVGPVKKLVWDDTSITLPGESVNFVYFTSEGTLAASQTIPAPLEAIVLGRVIMDATGSGALIENIPTNARHPTNGMNRMMRQVAGSIYQTGSVVSENSTSARKIDVTPGIYWYGDKRITPQGGTAITFYQVMSGDGFTYEPLDVVPNDIYDLNGVETALPAGKFVKHALWTVGEDVQEAWTLSLGQVVFDTLLEAETGPLPVPPATFGNSFALVALLVMQEGENSIVQIYDARSTFGFKSPTLSASATHGNLLGLEADDHTQYLLANGGRAMAGNLNMGGHNISNIGTIDGLNLMSHGSRHNPNGSDPLSTAAPNASLNASSTNSVGVANSYARSDHTHEITGFQPLSSDLTAIAALSSTGFLVKTGDGTVATRSIQGTSNQITVSNGNGVSSGASISIVNNPVLPGSGSVTVPGGSNALRPSTLAAGMLRWNTTSAALEFSEGTGWFTVETVKNWNFTGDVTGTGNGSVALQLAASGVSAGTYRSVTVDNKGRVTAGTNPTTLAGYGITDGLLTTAATTTATANKLLYLNASSQLPADITGNSATATKLATSRTLSLTGDATGSLSFDGSANASAALTLANSGVTTGTYQGLTIDAKGRVTSALNMNYLTSNQNITVSGDATGSGTTSIALTLANTGVAAGTYTRVNVDAKGRVTGGNDEGPRQIVSAKIIARTANGVIAADTSTPLSTEGTQIWSQSFTPTSATSSICISQSFNFTPGTNGAYVIAAVFRGTTCIGTAIRYCSNNGRPEGVSFQIQDDPGTASTVTYSCRVGASANSTWYVNSGSTITLGGSMANQNYMITEF
jgi:phage-related tail fiber protein